MNSEAPFKTEIHEYLFSPSPLSPSVRQYRYRNEKFGTGSL